jgi:hypothetical protein
MLTQFDLRRAQIFSAMKSHIAMLKTPAMLLKTNLLPVSHYFIP